MPEHCPHLKSCAKATGKKACLHWLSFPMREASEPDNAPGVYVHDCAFNWTSRMLFQVSRQLWGVQAATESGRNETVKRQDVMLQLLDNLSTPPRAIGGNGQERIIDARSED